MSPVRLIFINHVTAVTSLQPLIRRGRVIGGPIDFASESHRNIVGLEMVRELRRKRLDR